VVSLLTGPGVQSGGLRLAAVVLPVLEQLALFSSLALAAGLLGLA
jgi:hypothetical protein